MAQFDIYANPGSKCDDIPYLVCVQNNHVSRNTGITVVIPLRRNATPVDMLAPLVEVPGKGDFVLSTDELFAIETARLKQSVGSLSPLDRARIRPALDKLFGDY